MTLTGVLSRPVRKAIPSQPFVGREPGAWWLAPGVDRADCVGAWRGKGAASYAASLTNLNAPGTHNLIGYGDITWAALTGWAGMVNAVHLSINGSWYPTNELTVLIQFTDANDFSMQFCGASQGSGLRENGISINNVGAYQGMYNWGSVEVSGVVLDGNLAIAGKRFYRDGAHAGTISAGTGTNEYDWYWGSENWADTPHGGNAGCNYIALCCFDAILTDAQVLTIATQMAAL